MTSNSPAKAVVGELVAEVIVPFVRVFGALLVLGAFGPFYAAALLGALTYVTGSVFGLELNLVGDALVNLQLLVIKIIDNRKKKTQLTTRTIVLAIVKIIIDIVMPMLSGLAYRWVANASLPLAYQIQNVLPNSGPASYVMTGIVVMLAYHILDFAYIYTADGYGATLATGVTYFGASALSYIMIQSFLDIGVNIGIAFAIFPAAQVVEWWCMLLTYLIAGALTIVLYYLLWNMWFSAEVRKANKEMGLSEDLEGLVNEKKQDAELGVQSGHSRHARAVGNF